MQGCLMVFVMVALVAGVGGYVTKDKKRLWCIPQVGCLAALREKYMTNSVEMAHKTCKELDVEGRLVGQAEAQKLLNQENIIQEIERLEDYPILLDATMYTDHNTSLVNFIWGYDKTPVEHFQDMTRPECGNGVLAYENGKIAAKMCVKDENKQFIVICAFPCKKMKNLTLVKTKQECNEICVNHPPCIDSIFFNPSVCILQPNNLQDDCSVHFASLLLKEEYLDEKVVTKRDVSSGDRNEDFLKLIVTTITFVFAAVGFVVCICFCVQYIKTGALTDEFKSSLKLSTLKQPNSKREMSLFSKRGDFLDKYSGRKLERLSQKRGKNFEVFSTSSFSNVETEKSIEKKRPQNKKSVVMSPLKDQIEISYYEEPSIRALATASGKIDKKQNLNTIKKNAPLAKIDNDFKTALTKETPQPLEEPRRPLLAPPPKPAAPPVLPAKTALVKETSVRETPVKAVPVKEIPVKTPPPKEIPVNAPPPKEIPVKTPPAKENPVKAPPAKEIPVKAPPDKEIPVKETPLKAPPVKETPLKVSPAKVKDDSKFTSKKNKELEAEMRAKAITKETLLKAEQRKEKDAKNKRHKSKNDKKRSSERSYREKDKLERAKEKKQPTPTKPKTPSDSEGTSVSSIDLDSDSKKKPNLRELAAKIQKFRTETFGKH